MIKAKSLPGQSQAKRSAVTKGCLLLAALLLTLAVAPFANAFADESNQTSTTNKTQITTDASTIDGWQDLDENNTADVGRIWTDKSVSGTSLTTGKDPATGKSATVSAGDSDFVTALSALSSTSNVTSTVDTPLDIVLVLDASKSMDSDLGTGTNRTTRIKALRTAANKFIDEIAKQNDRTNNVSLQHQVSIVKFAGAKSNEVGNDTYEAGGYTYNYSQVMKAMSPCTNTTADDFKKTIEDINPNGCTRSDCGLELAKEQTSGRTGEDGNVAAKKIVVFFTDGKPTNMSEFEDGVASPAVAVAKSMKDAGATIYTIGIFDGANASSDPTGQASRENKFMQAVSSNYPDATYKEGSPYTWDFGNRAKDSDFYKSAADASDLEKVFEDIAQNISKGTGHPTKTTEGAEFESGYVTFDDPLGAYMQVDDVAAIVANGVKYEDKTKETDGTTATYRFSATPTINNKEANLGKILITVTKSKDPSKGDVVKVKIPSAMIPQRYLDVDENQMVMSITETSPLSVFYTSSLKDETDELLKDPDTAMASYLKSHTKSGKVSFLANSWDGKSNGDTVASFEPSRSNKYYYFTEDTSIYTDKTCSDDARATKIEAGKTYWYKSSFYSIVEQGIKNGACAVQSNVIPFKGSTALQFSGAIGKDDKRELFFKAGTARLEYIAELDKSKAKNTSETANNALKAQWNDTTSTKLATMVRLLLGNNGKLETEAPGALTVTKRIEVSGNQKADDFANEEFEFTIKVPSLAGKTIKAQLTSQDTEAGERSTTSLEFDSNGTASFKLKAGQTLKIKGLSSDISYAIEEAEKENWKQTESSGTTGKIEAGKTSEALFVNSFVEPETPQPEEPEQPSDDPDDGSDQTGSISEETDQPQTENNNETSEAGNMPHTGDNTLFFAGVIAAIAAGCVLLLVALRKGNRRNH